MRGSSPSSEPQITEDKTLSHGNKTSSPHGRRKKRPKPRVQMSAGSVDDLDNCEEVDKFVSEVLEQAKWEYLHGDVTEEKTASENENARRSAPSTHALWPTSSSRSGHWKKDRYHGKI